MKKYLSLLLIPLLSCLLLVGCATSTSTTPTGTTVTTTTITPEALALIQSGASIATGAVLDFAVTDPTQRAKLANEMYSAANAIYSLSTGKLPTVAQFQSAILAFGGSQKDANYATFTTSVTALYSTYYTKYNTGNVSNANQVLASLAAGIQSSTVSYVSITPAS